MERDPKLTLSIELTQREAQVLLVYLGRMLPYDLGPTFREDSRLFNRAAKRLCAALEKELAKIAIQGVRRERPATQRR